MEEQVVVILRGISGSGKSERARKYRSRGAKIVSADDYMRDRDGNYEFDADKLKSAHAKCQARFVEYLHLDEAPMVVVDNANCRHEDFEFYVICAVAVGARIDLISLFDGNKTDQELADRNVHLTPVDIIATQRANYEFI